MATIIKSVTLVPGEKFTLPPGSKLIGSTDIGNLTSNCDIPTLEELTCYVAIFGSNIDNGTTGTAFYEGETSLIKGYRFNGVVTNFAEAYAAGDLSGVFALEDMGTELKTLVPAIIATDDYVVGDGDRGALNMLLIQTIPSVAEKLQLTYVTYAAIDDESVNNTGVTTYIDFITREQAVALNYNNVPACPTEVPET